MATINQADAQPNNHGNDGNDFTDNHTDRMRDRLVRLPEVLMRTGLKRSTLYQKVKTGTFPRQKPLGLRIVAWYESEVEAWIADPR